MVSIERTARDWAWGIAVALLGLCVTAYVAVYQERALQQLEQERLEHSAHAFSESLTRRLDAYTEIAFGLRSLFIVNPATSRKAFEAAVVRLDAQLRYPGIKNIAFTRYVPAARKQAFERAVRSDTSLDPAGYPGFSIRPPGERAEYFVADYLWPQSGSKGVHGLDISVQPANLASMRYAMATGKPTASGPFDLIQEVADKTGFVVRVPVFSEGPDKQFLGAVAVTLRVHDLLGALESEGALQGLQLALTDVGSSIAGSPPAQPVSLYARPAALGQGPQVHTRMLDVYGRQWQLQASAQSSFLSVSERRLPLWVGLTGALVSALMGTLVGLLGKGRRQALDTLAATHALLQSVMEHVPIRVFWKDRECRYLGCNQLFALDAGCSSPDEVVGRTDDALGWAANAALYQQDDQAVMDSGQARLRFVEPQTTPDGKTLWLQTSKVPLRNAQGEVVGILGIYDDITELRSKDEELARYRSDLEYTVSKRTAELQAAIRQLRDTQLAMDSVGIGILWIDVASASLRDVNRYAARLLGYTGAQVRGMQLSDITPSIDAEAFQVL
ncbi:MAG: CHASE domain-containing protein, partial [Rhodoferax sp.]|nr:CHASE domain-containing protein [Rhodoferax sp.]